MTARVLVHVHRAGQTVALPAEGRSTREALDAAKAAMLPGDVLASVVGVRRPVRARLSEVEDAEVREAARAAGQPLGAWAREVLLAAARGVR